jgi:uncharacterized phage protein gp47/JayE
MTVFAPPSVLVDRTAIKAKAVAKMQEELPAWRLEAGTVEDVLFDAWSWVAAEQAEMLISQIISGLRTFGPLIGVPPIEAQAATAVVTVTASAAAPAGGYTLEERELTVGIVDADGELQAWELLTPLVIAEGATTGTATVAALEAGTKPNGLSGAVSLIEAPAWVASAAIATSGGGVEAEDDAAFLDRLVETLSTVRSAPVKAQDASLTARSVAGIGRAAAVDNLKPGSAWAAYGGAGTENQSEEKSIVVACTDEHGVPSDSAHLAAVKAKLEELRESNFLFFVLPPSIVKINVTATVYAWPGRDLAGVKAEVEGALKEVLSPASWGTDSTGKPSHWVNDQVVRLSEIFAAIMAPPGVRWCSSASFGKAGSALGTADVDMNPGSKVPVLPEAGTLTITVNAST